MSNEPVDLGDPASVRERNRDLKAEAAAEENVVRSLLANPQLRAWWWERLSAWGLFQSGYYPSTSELYFRQGQREVGLSFLALFQSVPDLYTLMVNEASAQKENTSE